MKFLCAVTKKDDRYYQVLTEATLHNIPLRIIHVGCFHGLVTEPKSDDGAVDAFLKKVHSDGVSKNMNGNSFLF